MIEIYALVWALWVNSVRDTPLSEWQAARNRVMTYELMVRAMGAITTHLQRTEGYRLYSCLYKGYSEPELLDLLLSRSKVYVVCMYLTDEMQTIASKWVPF